jgi:nucleoside recognition membrane protein YjiH
MPAIRSGRQWNVPERNFGDAMISYRGAASSGQ